MKLLDETSDLTEKRPSVAVVNEKESVLQGFSIGADTRASMADINAQLVVLRGAPRKGSNAPPWLVDGRTAGVGDLPAYIWNTMEIT